MVWAGFCRVGIRGSSDHRSQDPQLVGDGPCPGGGGLATPVHSRRAVSNSH